MKRVLLFVAICALLLAACADEPAPLGFPPELREIVEANRAIALPPLHPNFEEISSGLLTSNADAETDARISRLINLRSLRPPVGLPSSRAVTAPISPDARLSHEEITEDLAFLFDLLPLVWGAYGYFGGDEVFLPLRESMLAQLASMSDPLSVESFLEDLIVPRFHSVARDNHFQIHNVTFVAPEHDLFMSEDYVLRRGEEGFVVEIDGITYIALGTELPDGSPVEGVVPTLAPDGELVWAFGIADENGFHPLRFRTAERRASREIVALLANSATGERVSRAVSLSMLVSNILPEPPAPFDMEGVAFLEGRSMLDPYKEPLLRGAWDMRDSPVLILDIRGIGGGASIGKQWVRGYAGREPAGGHSFVEFQRGSAAALSAGGARGPMVGNRPGWIRLDPLDPERASIPNENLLIVLTDWFASSGGDELVGHLRQLENVLFIGANTHGNLLSGGIGRTMLPRSRLDVIFGMYLNLRPDLSQFEGVGFMPDLWVHPDYALERTLAFIERYGLAR